MARVRTILVCLAGMLTVAATLSAQNPIRYIYDDLGRLVGVIDASGNAAVYHYDAVGNLLSITRSTPTQVNVIDFTPDTGAIGQTVTIYGTGFSATAAQNTVTFNGTSASVSSATTTQLVVTVPSGASTGLIGVTSPNGSDSSDTAFTISSASTPTITSFTPTSAVAGTAITITGTNFDASVPANNQSRFNSSYTTPSSATSTTVTASVAVGTGSGRVSIKTAAGTAVSAADLIVPPAPYVVTDVANASRVAFGSANTVNVPTANKIALRLFDGTQGQRVSLLGTNGLSGQVLNCDVTVTLLTPFVAPVSGGCMELSGFVDAKPLPVTGTYSILVDPAGTATGSVTLTVYDVPPDYTSALTPGGAAVTATMSTPGQNGLLTFSGTTGQRVSLLGTNGISGQIGLVCDVGVSVWKPDGGLLASPTCMEASGFIDVMTLPVGGPYKVVVDPTSAATGSLTLTAYNVPADYSSSITAGGASVTAVMATPGQNGGVTFSGTAGQRISLAATNALTGYIAFACDVNLRIIKPDTSVLVPDTCVEGSGFVDVTTLPATGTYTIFVNPVAQSAGNVTLTLYSVPTDYSGSITAGGSAVTASLPTPGQNGALTFAGTSGQRISLSVTNAIAGFIAFACDVNLRILKPDTSVLVADTCVESSGFIDVTSLPATGTYKIVLDPLGPAAGNVTVALYSVPADYSGTITAGGAAVTASMPTPGQNGAMTFSGTSGQRVSLVGTNGLTGFIAFACDVNVSILKPDLSVLAANTCMEGAGFIDLLTLPVTGTYKIVLDPVSLSVGNVTLQLYTVPADTTGTVTIGAAAVAVPLATPGQNARRTFSGTASQQVTVRLTSNTFGFVTVSLLKPDGSTLTTGTSTGNFNLATQTLPTTGTYTIVIDPNGAATGTISVNVTSP